MGITYSTSNRVLTTKEGVRTELKVQDDNSHSLMERMLKELKKLVLHLSIVTDNTIKNSEVE